MKVAIYSRGLEADQQGQFISLLHELQKYNTKISIYKPLADLYPSIKQLFTEIDFFFNAFWGKPLHDKWTSTEVVEN